MGNGLKCCHCLHESTDADPVVWKAQYIGGIGYQDAVVCKDEVSCWARWDRMHGLKDTAAIRADDARRLVYGARSR